MRPVVLHLPHRPRPKQASPIILKLVALRDSGVITEEEFQAHKAKLLQALPFGVNHSPVEQAHGETRRRETAPAGGKRSRGYSRPLAPSRRGEASPQ